MTARKKDPSKAGDSSARARKIQTLRFSEQFEKDLKKASEEDRKNAERTLKRMLENGDFLPAMRPKKLTDKIWYLRAGGDTRITFGYESDGVIYLRRIGGHSILKCE